MTEHPSPFFEFGNPTLGALRGVAHGSTMEHNDQLFNSKAFVLILLNGLGIVIDKKPNKKMAESTEWNLGRNNRIGKGVAFYL